MYTNYLESENKESFLANSANCHVGSFGPPSGTVIGLGRATMNSETGGDKLNHDRLARYSASIISAGSGIFGISMGNEVLQSGGW